MEVRINKLKSLCNDFNGVQKAIDEIYENIRDSVEYSILEFLDELYYDIIKRGHGYKETKFAFEMYKAAIQFHKAARIM